MKILEFQQPVMFHTSLNPLLWDDDMLLPEVRKKLLAQAREFLKFLKLPNIPLVDIVITGSNTNLTYTPHSDLDLHVIVDMDKVYNGSPMVEQMFDSKRRLWNMTYDIKIHGIPVEIYVEDDDEHVEGNAYSLVTNSWIQRKPLIKTEYDDRSVRAKFASFKREIKRTLDRADSPDDLDRLMKKLKNYRQSGLDKHGEFSTENLTFKALRNAGLLDDIAQARTQLVNTELSLDEILDIF